MNKPGKIFLSGGGSEKKSYDFDCLFFKSIPKESKILYIPIAMEREITDYGSCHDWFTKVISLQEDKDINFSMLLEKDPMPDFDQFDAIYIGGGNTFKLLDYLVENNLLNKLLDYYKKGGVIYGGSAGAIIFGETLLCIEEENDNNYINSLGLNILNNFSIRCHYEKEKDFEIQNKISKEKQINILALPEGSGIIFSEDKVEYFGDVLEIK